MATEQHVLIPVDFSGYSLLTIEGLKNLGIQLSEVTLVHVLDSESRAGGATLDTTPEAPDTADKLRAHFVRELEKFRDAHFGDDVKVHLAVEDGDSPGALICARAATSAATLIAISTHGRTGLAHVIMGSVAEKVVQKAPCPTLVFRRLD